MASTATAKRTISAPARARIESDLAPNGFVAKPKERTQSPARDLQLRLERDVLHSLSSRHSGRQVHCRGSLAWIVGAAAGAWALIFAIPMLFVA